MLCILSTNKKIHVPSKLDVEDSKKLSYKSPISFFSGSLNLKVIHHFWMGCITTLICTKPFSFTNLVNAVFLRLTNCMFCNVLIVFLTKCITFSCTHTLLEKNVFQKYSLPIRKHLFTILERKYRKYGINGRSCNSIWRKFCPKNTK